MRAPNLSLRFAISEIKTMRNAVMKYLEIKNPKINFHELQNSDQSTIQLLLFHCIYFELI